MSDVRLRDAAGATDMETVRAMFREYAGWLGVDLCFQGFEQELQDLPGFYDRPRGCLLFAEAGDGVACLTGSGMSTRSGSRHRSGSRSQR